MIYFTFLDDVDYPANHTGPYDQGDPPAKLRLIGYHEEYNVFVIPCDLLYLHAQNNKSEWASTFPT